MMLRPYFPALAILFTAATCLGAFTKAEAAPPGHHPEVTGPLPQQYAGHRPDMVQGAIKLWNMVIEDGQDKAAVEEGRKRLEELQKLADGAEK